MDQTFGTRLRQHREQQQISLEAIARDTKIKQSLLEGLERDSLSHWPGGIFRRAYVRSYAKAIHLNPDEVLREFLDCFPDPTDLAEEAVAAIEASIPQSGLRRVVSSALAAVPLFARHERSPAVAVRKQEPIVVERHASVAATDLEVDPAVEQAACEPAMNVAACEEREEPTADQETIVGRAEPLLETAVPVVTANASPIAAIADICGRIARVADWGDVDALLADASYALRAAGMIVWAWEPRFSTLRPVLAHGYADEVLDRMPAVRRDSDNALASAFRSGEVTVVPAAGAATGAVIVPMLTASTCAGILTIELHDRREDDESTRALAAILGAQLAALFGGGAGNVVEAASA